MQGIIHPNSTLFLSMRKLSANFIQEIHFYVNSVWFDFQAKLHSVQGQKVQHRFGWTLIGRIDLFAGVVPEAWGRAIQWLELKHRETSIPLSLFLQNTVTNHSFQLRPQMTTWSVAVHNSVSIDLSTFLSKVQTCMPIFPHMPPRCLFVALRAAWPFPNGRRCKINDRISGDHVQGHVSKLTVTAAQETQRALKDAPVSENNIHNTEHTGLCGTKTQGFTGARPIALALMTLYNHI